MTHRTTTRHHVADLFPSAYGGDGYDAMEAMRTAGIRIYAGWGRDGWDAGDWPYVQVGTRRTSEGVEAVVYVEGDIDITRYDTFEQAIRHLDEVVHWYWQGNRGPTNPDLNNPDHCGPFQWHRLCTPDEPMCRACREEATR